MKKVQYKIINSLKKLLFIKYTIMRLKIIKYYVIHIYIDNN